MENFTADSEQLRERLEAKLQPWRIRATLSFAGLYQLTHELIKTAVVDGVRQFYLTGFDESGSIYDEVAYAEKVLALDSRRRPFPASLRWLVELEAISARQADRLDRIYAHRHELTHELGRYIVDLDFEPDMQLFVDALEILRDIHRFWTQIEFDFGTFEEYGSISLDDVTPGPILLLQMCVDAYVEGLEDDGSDQARA
ncbi:hypothetical protein GCM10029963_32700 [Micromonospora andamanensis]|uniref:hypothetical protein n=1 Tax=Micromonospora andamanensis TaxID=1287068 RepID=UPI00194DF8FF|nr:hypothetical protein [Micromonospora andamanensis]GIJ42950.1 hypothetical protein Vwe01_62750 [Micromonospora andamanensis]